MSKDASIVVPTGWICPKCGSVYSPFVSACGMCAQGAPTFTSPTTSCTCGTYATTACPVHHRSFSPTTDWKTGAFKKACLLSALLLLLLLPTFAQAQEAPGPLTTFTHASIAGTMVLQGTDLAVTMFTLGANQGREANPFFAPFVSNPPLAGAVKMGVAAGSAWLLLRYHADHPKLVLAASLAMNAVLVGVVAHNARLETRPR